MRRSAATQGKTVARSAWVGRGEASLEAECAAAGGVDGARAAPVRRGGATQSEATRRREARRAAQRGRRGRWGHSGATVGQFGNARRRAASSTTMLGPQGRR
uniref:Uncharacterized protein n=1 Tax=Arundo donax TaxID=35708 RepID=A0A0A8YWI0_ARUDO